MKQIDLDYIVIALLLVSTLYVAMTGLVMDLFGSPQFLWHRYAGYAGAGLAGLHLALNWGRATAYLKRRFRRLTGRAVSAQRQRASRRSRRGFLLSVLAAVGSFALGGLIFGRRLVALPDEAAVNAITDDLGLLYHQWSQPGPSLILRPGLNWGRQPGRYKTYAGAEHIGLPDPDRDRGLRLEAVLQQRRSRREYTAEPMSLAELAQLLHAASGITDPARGYRAAPSAGALYPIETYAVVHNVEGLGPGIYHYAVADHALERLRTGSVQTELVVAGIGQEMLGQAQVCFILSALFQRTRWKYRERTYRYVLLEAGHIGQNLYLAATSLGLGACAVGAFLDHKLNNLLGLDGEAEAALYIIAVGKVSSAQ